MITVTPRLIVGTPEEAKTRVNGYFVESAEDAVHAMMEDYTAVIPEENWETTARIVLMHFLDTPEKIEETIYFAQTGKLPKQDRKWF